MKEIVFSICVIAAAAVAFTMTLSFPPELAIEGGVGPAFFPQTVAVLLALLGLLLLAGSARRLAGKTGKKGTADTRPMKAVATAFLLIVGYAAALHVVGFPIGTLAFLVATISFYLSPIGWKRVLGFSVPVAAAITAASYGLFGVALRIPLPTGLFF